jgi:hypothetical protein
MTNELSHPLRESVFRWSYFYDDTNFVPYDSEYPDDKTAESRHRFEDRQIASDTGQEVRKMLFGIYASKTEAGMLIFSANEWDREWNRRRGDLVGSATVMDWEWDRQAGDVEFTEEKVLEVLQDEVSELTIWYARREQADASLEELAERLKTFPVPTNKIELLDLYHVWRTFFALRSEITSGAEVYKSISLVRDILDKLLNTLTDKLTNETNESPEEFIIDQIEHANRP